MDLRLSKAYWFFSLAYSISHKILHCRLSIYRVHHQFIDQIWSYHFMFVLLKNGKGEIKINSQELQQQVYPQFQSQYRLAQELKSQRREPIFNHNSRWCLRLRIQDFTPALFTHWHYLSFQLHFWFTEICIFFFMFTMLINVLHTPA